MSQEAKITASTKICKYVTQLPLQPTSVSQNVTKKRNSLPAHQYKYVTQSQQPTLCDKMSQKRKLLPAHHQMKANVWHNHNNFHYNSLCVTDCHKKAKITASSSINYPTSLLALFINILPYLWYLCVTKCHKSKNLCQIINQSSTKMKVSDTITKQSTTVSPVCVKRKKKKILLFVCGW